MANTPLLRTLLLPPLLALALYLTLTYLLLPLYRRHRERATYSLLPTSLSSSSPSSSIFSTFTSAIGNAILRAAGTSRSALYREGGHGGGGWGGRGSSEDEEFGLGDEELEEGVVLAGPPPGEDAGRGRGGGGGDSQVGPPIGRRLSRDLEGGFMDDSDDEEEEGQGGRRMGR